MNEGMVARRVGSWHFPARLLLGEDGITGHMIYWTLALASAEDLEKNATQFLSQLEKTRLSGMRFPKRRREWLLGRWAAKRLAASQLPALQGKTLDAFAVLNQPEGAPYLAWADGTPIPAALSISHREDRAFCTISLQADLLLGADLERIEPRIPGFVCDYFTENEQAFFLHQPLELQEMWVTAAWSLKEAVLKALGKGLRVDTRQVEVNFTEQPESFPIGSERWRTAGVRTMGLGPQIFQAYWQRQKDFVLTIAASEEGKLVQVAL